MSENLPVIKKDFSLDFSNEEIIKTLKATVAAGATNEEFAMFSEFCKSTGLNPFKKEIWFVKAGGRVQMMTGINGFLAIANSHPEFDGMEVDVEVDNQGNPLKAVCKVFRKDRSRPSTGIALMKEFRKETPIWKTMPSVMLTKVAKSIALREAFPQELNGLYTQEEMPPDYALDPRPKQTDAPLPSRVEPSIKVTPSAKMNAKQKRTLKAMEENTAYEYDLHGIGNKYPSEEEKQAVWKIATRDYGVIAKGKVAYSAMIVEEWEGYLMNEKIEPVVVSEGGIDPLIDDGIEDDLPESFNEKLGEGATNA